MLALSLQLRYSCAMAAMAGGEVVLYTVTRTRCPTRGRGSAGTRPAFPPNSAAGPLACAPSVACGQQRCRAARLSIYLPYGRRRIPVHEDSARSTKAAAVAYFAYFGRLAMGGLLGPLDPRWK